MSASKGLTRQTRLRTTDEEYELLATVQRVYGAAGVRMSLNDTVRHLIRRAEIVPACTPAAAHAQIREHCASCRHCLLDTEQMGCPEGLYLYRNWRRVESAHADSGVTDAL